MMLDDVKKIYWSLATELRRHQWRRDAHVHLNRRPPHLAGRSSDYQNFMILTHPRSGSTLLADGLNSLPSVVSYGELFTPNFIDYMVAGYRDSQTLRHLRLKMPERFLAELVYGGYSPDIKAVGFKLFPEHFDYKPEFQPGRRWLLGNARLKVIRLVRHNLLKYYVSLELARRTRVWRLRQTPDKVPETTLSVDPVRAEHEFLQRSTRDQHYRDLFARHQILDLSYEELELDPENTFMRVQRFLGLEPAPVVIGLSKQETRSLPEIIENYDELCRRWAGTRWEVFLED